MQVEKLINIICELKQSFCELKQYEAKCYQRCMIKFDTSFKLVSTDICNLVMDVFTFKFQHPLQDIGYWLSYIYRLDPFSWIGVLSILKLFFVII